jgi:hypothetical protein
MESENLLPVHGIAIFVAKDVLEQYLQRIRQVHDGARAILLGRPQTVVSVTLAFEVENLAC